MTEEIRDNPDKARYELAVDGEVIAHTDYERDGNGRLVLVHTEVDKARRRRGYAATVVRAALDDVRARGEQVEVRCRYVASFIERHPEYADLLAA